MTINRRKTLTALVILILMITLILFLERTQDNKTNENNNKTELIIYNRLFDDIDYSYKGQEFPLSESDIKRISGLINTADIIPRYDFDSSYAKYGIYADLYIPENQRLEFLENLENSTISIRDTSGREFAESDYPNYIRSYSDYDRFDDRIIEEFCDEGVYLTEGLWKDSCSQIAGIPYIYITVPVPLYNCSGCSETGYPVSGGDFIYKECNYVMCKPEAVILPVRGIVTRADAYKGFVECMYIPDHVFEQYIKEADIQENHTVYILREQNEYYIDELPEKYSGLSFGTSKEGPDFKIEMERWMPNGYSVYVDSVGQAEKILRILSDAGFSADMIDYVN